MGPPLPDEDQRDIVRMIRESASAIAPREAELGRIRALRFGEPGYDRAVWRRMAALGWIGLRLPEAAGGSGLGMSASVALYEELGRGLVPEPLIAGSLAATLLAETQETGLLDRVLMADAMVVLAWQGKPDAIEPADVEDVRLFVPMGRDANVFLVPRATELHLFTSDEVDVTPVALQDGTCAASVRIPEAARRVVMDAAGEPLARALDEAALGTAGYALGIAERAFEITLAYLKQRQQFGQALAAFQALQHRMADMKIQLTLARASIESAADELDRGADRRSRAIAVSRAKARAADTAMLVAREAVQMHGAIGYADECDIGLFTRKAMVVANQFGSALAHRRRFARLAGDLEGSPANGART